MEINPITSESAVGLLLVPHRIEGGIREKESRESIDSAALVPSDDAVKSLYSTKGGGRQVNRFLLCTLVWGAAREIKARAQRNGESVSLRKIARDILNAFLTGESSDRWNEAVSMSPLDLFEEKILGEEITRQFQQYFEECREQSADARQLDIEAIIAAVEAKGKHRLAKRD